MKFATTPLAILMTLVLFSIMAVSCSDDDDDKSGGAAYIVGTWSDDGTDDWYEDGGDAYGYLFKSNGTYIEHGSSSTRGTYEIKKNKLYLYSNDYDEEYRFKISGDKLILFWYDEYDDDYTDEEIYFRVK